MSARQLGKCAKIYRSRASGLVNAELDGDLKLSSLKKIAEAIDMHFVYASYLAPAWKIQSISKLLN